MPLQNRVDPQGKLCAIKAYGTLMGNRGKLHNNQQEITRRWHLQRWITCALKYKGIKRQLMSPNSYTELFFLDEPTSYAAGHRPCSECRKDRYKAFKASWAEAFPDQDQSAAAIDRALHSARLNPDGSQRTWLAKLAGLPDGAMVEAHGLILLLWQGEQWQWSFHGYKPIERPLSGDEQVTVLTPEPLIKLFANGLAMNLQVHNSAIHS